MSNAIQGASPTAGRRADGAAPWVLLALAVGTALRVFRLDQNSLWVDEFVSLQVASAPLGEIPAAALQGSAFEPPVYFWLLHATVRLLGSSEIALRAPSAVVGILTVPLVWLLVRELTGERRSATVAALLLAVNPLHVWYSQEARPYALTVFFGSASLLCLGRALRGTARGPWVGYLVFGALAILSHLTAIAVPAIGTGLVLLHERRWELLRSFVGFSAGIALLILPFFLALADSIEPGSSGSPPRALTGLEAFYALFTYLAGYSFGPAVREIQNLGWRAAVERQAVQTLIGVTALCLIAAVVLRHRPRGMGPMTVILTVPFALAIIGAWVSGKAFNVRYTLLALLGFFGLAGAGVAALGPRARVAGVGGLVGLSLWADAQWFQQARYWKEDSRAAVACLAEVGAGDATVAVAPDYMEQVLEYYAKRAGLRMEILGVSSVEQVVASPASVLLTTRLHHAPDEASLIRRFRADGTGPVLETLVPGYRIHVRSPRKGSPVRTACLAAAS